MSNEHRFAVDDRITRRVPGSRPVEGRPAHGEPMALRVRHAACPTVCAQRP
jgi:hypothetical protein